MADRPPEPVVEDSLRDFLAAELRQAERDFPLIPRRAAVPARRRAPIGLLVAAVAVLALVVVAPRLLDLPKPGTGGTPVSSGGTPISSAGPPLSAEGLPLSISGEHVAQGGEIASRLSEGTFLAGGTLVLDTMACDSRSAVVCPQVWDLVAGPLDDPSAVFVLDIDAEAPGFVRTSGALTVARVHAYRSESGTLSSEFLVVESIPWRQATKGPVPDDATAPEGGVTNGALWPDFVSTFARDGVTIAGYIPKRYLLEPPVMTPGNPSDPPQPEPQPVYAEDLTTLVGHMVPGVGFVALGPAAERPASPSASVAASAAPWAPATVSASPSPFEIAPGVMADCGRIDPAACERSIALARATNEPGLGAATLIVVDDPCPPPAGSHITICDGFYAFSAIVIFVTAGADTTGWYAFYAFGHDPGVPARAERSPDQIPQHIVDRVRAALATP
jgi:hypothetical protein